MGRPLHVQGSGPGWLVPSPTSGHQFRPSTGPAAQARTILSPQSQSVGSGVVARPDLGRGPGRARSLPCWPDRTSVGRPLHVPGRGPCSQAVGWHSRPRVAVSFDCRRGRTPKPVPSLVPSLPQSDQAWWPRPFRAVDWLGPGWLAERQRAVRCTSRDRDPAG